MDLAEAIRQRRSIKRFTEQAVSRQQMERLLEAATLGPNHRLTQPWRFYVLGADARYAYGRALGVRKGRKLDDPQAAVALRDSVAAEHQALPAMLAVAVVESDNPEIREEDYAAAMMGIQNLALEAVAMKLGTHIKTGGIMNDPDARAAVGVQPNERIVAIVNIGYPAEIPASKNRQPAASMTRWVP